MLIFMTDVEVIVGDGELKEKPRKNKQKNTQVAEPLIKGTTDEEMIEREFDEPPILDYQKEEAQHTDNAEFKEEKQIKQHNSLHHLID